MNYKEMIDYMMSRILVIKNKAHKENKDVDIAIYISYKSFATMMRGMTGEVSSDVFDIFQSNGKSFRGYKIYKVEDDTHGIKVLALN